MTQRDVSVMQVVVIASVEPGHEVMRELTRDRYIAPSIGAALDAHAPDPAPGARYEIEVIGKAQAVL